MGRSYSIRNRLTASIFLGVLVPLALGVSVAAWSEAKALERDMAQESTLLAAMAAEYGAVDLAFDDRESCERTLAPLAGRADVLSAAFYDTQGELFCARQRNGAAQVPRHLATVAASAAFVGDAFEVFQPVMHGDTRYGTMHLRASTARVAARRRAFFWGLGFTAVALGAFALLLAFAVQRSISRPILALAQAAHRVTDAGDYAVRVAKASDDEIGSLADAFNTMVAEVARRQEALRRSEDALKQSYDELARTQQVLVAKERLAAVGELAAVMAHEVRNPLAVFFNSLEALRRELNPTGAARESLDILREEAERLNRIVDDLLDFARPAPPALAPSPLTRLLASAVEVATSNMPSAQVTFQVDVCQELPPVPLDERMMRQALINLLLNALQAMPQGGQVAVRAKEELRSGARFARVDVADTGPGMSPETAARVFQPFFTTKAKGTGLGLAVVRRFVEAHGGEVTVRSALGEGTTFTVLLPLGAPPPAVPRA